MKFQSVALSLVSWTVLAQAFTQEKPSFLKKSFVTGAKDNFVGAVVIAGAAGMLAAPQITVAAPIELYSEAAAMTHVTQHAPPSIISSSNLMLSGLMDNYEGVFKDEDPDATPQDSQMSDKEYFELQKTNAKEKKALDARKAEALKKYQAAEKERKGKERAMRLDIEKENQRLAVESSNRRAAELKMQQE